MRDIIVLIMFCVGVIWALRRPWVGPILFTWVSVMTPHDLGFATRGMPFAMIAAAVSLIGLARTRERQNPFLGPPVWALLAFVVWICITLPFSIYFEPSLPLWIRSMKIYAMLFVTLSLIDTRHKLDVFIWTIVLSLGFYGVKGGVFTLMHGGGGRVWGPGGFLSENNALGLGLLMTIPLMRYLQLQRTIRWQKHAFSAAMVLTAFAALGTQSRGALLGLGAMGMFLWWKSERKLIWAVSLIVVASALLAFMPESWWARMGTIGNYEEDSSAMGRINAWMMAWNMALHRPLGGGFEMYSLEQFMLYAPNPTVAHAHSIYFQVLGEHGFVGLFLFLMIGASTWWTAAKLIKLAKGDSAHRWAGDLGAMTQVSMVGYATGGAFLSLSYWDLPYDYMVAVVIALHLVRTDLLKAADVQGRARLASLSR